MLIRVLKDGISFLLWLVQNRQFTTILKTATHPTVMMLGHNPGISELAALLPARLPLDPDFRRYPTGATLVVDFQVDSWSQVEPGQGSVMDFVRLDGRN